MKQLKLLLAPQPGAKPEYLDDVSLANPSPAVLQFWNTTQFVPTSAAPLVLEAYTRDAWAWKPSPAWTLLTVTSATDRHHKLRGFCDYLKQRQKACYGRFAPRGLFVISYAQPKQNDATAFSMECRVVLDMAQIPKCNLKPLKVTTAPVVPEKAATKPRKAGGFLGKLVGAQQRTNHHVAVATAGVPKASAAITGSSINSNNSNNNAPSNAPVAEARTAGQVLADFRQSMQDKMLDFDLQEDQEKLQVKLNVAEHTAGLSTEDKTRITMEILKYMVYEAAEEVNEEWVAYKEPSEFMDEATIAVYKEGAAPLEVLEEINKGELPEEVRGQQRAIEQERQRQVNQAESRHKQKLEQDAHRYEAQEDDMAVLNVNKRDRRSIEDYEREKGKKGRPS